MGKLEEKIKSLPNELQKQVEHYVDELIKQQTTIRQKKKPLFKWAGALKDLRSSYTSVELQHKISSMRSEEL